MVSVLYEDNHLLVVEKPPNLPVQADASGDEDLLTILKAYIKQKYDKPGDVYLGLVHRLDRPVGGVMVFARTSKAASRLAPQFASHTAEKSYLAVLCGNAEGGALVDFILRDTLTGNSFVVPESTPDAKRAALSYEPMSQAGGLTLARISLQTGRHHQIRVQFASRGLPLWGDQRYNKNAVPGQQIALWACALSFEHPTTHERLSFSSLPKGGVWESFATVLPAAAAGIPIAYIDGDIIAVDKPAGLPVAMADGGCDTLEARLASLGLAAQPAHRLDANTTGLVLFARNQSALEALTKAIEARSVRKLYRCIVRGTPTPIEATLTAYCTKDAQSALLAVFDHPVPNCRDMITRYKVLETNGETSSLEVELITGRTHQIRAHMAHIGHPVLGDDKYGDREFNRRFKRRTQALRAVKLELHFAETSYLSRLDGAVIAVSDTIK